MRMGGVLPTIIGWAITLVICGALFLDIFFSPPPSIHYQAQKKDKEGRV